MTTQQVPAHPVIACAQTLEKTLMGAGDLQPAYLTTGQKREALTTLARVRAELDELLLRVLAASDDVADLAGFRNAGTWLAHAIHDSTPAGHGEAQLAKALDQKYGRVAEAMRAGQVNRAQARVIVTALDRLPAEVEAFARKKAERHLVQLAKDHGPGELRQLGDHLLEVIAPEAAEALEAKALEREEQRSLTKSSLHLRNRGDGTGALNVIGPMGALSRLMTYLEARTSPRVTSEEVQRRPRSVRLAQAFCALIEHLNPDQLPDHGGDATTVIVTIDHDKLTHDVATASLLGGLEGEIRISATEARRLACNANILPAVLGGKGEVLDLGRSRRLFNAAQRKALMLRDKQCRAEGCSIPHAGVKPSMPASPGPRRQDRHRRRRPALQLASPPRPRHPLHTRPPTQRRLAVPPQNVRASDRSPRLYRNHSEHPRGARARPRPSPRAATTAASDHASR